MTTTHKPLPKTIARKVAKAKTVSELTESFEPEILARALLTERTAPSLGHATTSELHDELASRAVLGGYGDYRTVDID